MKPALCRRQTQALMRAAAVGKPVIVTETGIPDGDDSRREMWATQYLRAVRRWLQLSRMRFSRQHRAPLGVVSLDC